MHFLLWSPYSSWNTAHITNISSMPLGSGSFLCKITGGDIYNPVEPPLQTSSPDLGFSGVNIQTMYNGGESVVDYSIQILGVNDPQDARDGWRKMGDVRYHYRKDNNDSKIFFGGIDFNVIQD